MSTWSDVEREAPELAPWVQARFEATGLALVATLRADGSPRVSGWEPLFALGQVWLGSMPGSRKNDDLRRDPRLTLHSATVDKQATDGDAKLSGTAVEVTDDETKAAYAAAFEAEAGEAVPQPFVLWRVEPDAVSRLRPGGDHLDLDWWQAGKGVVHLDRY